MTPGRSRAANDGTVSSSLARLVSGVVADLGMNRGQFAHLPDLRPEVLADDLARVSTPTMIALWEQLTLSDAGTAIGVHVADQAPVGTLGLWDYLYTTGPSLIETTPRALTYLDVIGDPGADRTQVLESGSQFIVGHATGPAVPDVVEAIEIFVLALFLKRSREATARPIVPLRVSLSHRAPREHRRLTEFFGTTRIDYEAPANSITLLDEDAHAPLPQSQPGLAKILQHHADLTLAAAKPVLCWYDSFRVALDIVFDQNILSLEAVAERLAMSPRTLQRRLAEHETTWRTEVEKARQTRALTLLRNPDLSMRSIARRVGYSDERVLRRAVRRWHGAPPIAVRNGLATD
ncbi:AraC family transcriptional regulator [Nocardia huaxiensis]|uniref:AraC family transcriptional regulator n=1 Tax=Nocardia huaxiensis TaxID=2755382 RepID=UPI001E4170F9|nr:AraC family transcriptional regulator [Nocardia huaxiensis]UFS97326.1 AraC family transcriptional regulator [Nocardia huaxiensis]